MQYNYLLDVTGYSCPKPLLYTKKQLAQMKSGEILCVKLDDSKSLEDFGFFCNHTGHLLLNAPSLDNNVSPIILYIQVKS